MNSLRCRSSCAPSRHPNGWRTTFCFLASACTAGTAFAEPDAIPDGSAAVVARVQQEAPASRTVTPELNAVRSQLAVPGPVAYTADGRRLQDLAGVDYRLWISKGRTDVGVGVGALGYVTPPPGLRAEGGVQLTQSMPTMSVGLRYRLTPESSVFADASGLQRDLDDPDTRYVNTKVGMEWKPAKSRFGFENGRLGIHLDSGYKISLRARKGGIGVYLRGQF